MSEKAGQWALSVILRLALQRTGARRLWVVLFYFIFPHTHPSCPGADMETRQGAASHPTGRG